MKALPKILFIVAAISLLGMFTAPIWRISLLAPQYPQQLTMYIWINQITGDEPGTLQNINILNHYVGMKKIEPESIPELKFFPKVILAMVALGVILGFTNNKKMWIAWLVILAILGTLGIYDFYLWEYDYGHNLDPSAAIKVPGMAYQPPLFGTKMLLNFKATSLPHLGSLFIVIAFALGIIAIYLKGKQQKQS